MREVITTRVDDGLVEVELTDAMGNVVKLWVTEVTVDQWVKPGEEARYFSDREKEARGLMHGTPVRPPYSEFKLILSIVRDADGKALQIRHSNLYHPEALVSLV